MNDKPESKIKRGFYRLFDIAFSLMVLILFSPIYLMIGILIFCCSPGKVIYAQKRLGKGGKRFKCYKFRTMHVNADQRLREILKYNPPLQVEWKINQKLSRDPRIFTLGRFLRKTSLDEFPQFWNVLRGDLSVVGPRPYMISQKKELGPMAEKILSIRPGLTGLWQTSGRSSTTFVQRITLDARYVEKKSFKFDLLLIIKTIFQMLLAKNAH